ncbi:gliding motility-associated ABC transporter substrate-binding protein GldG [Labilibaculum sp. A4]|uniref:gliding motility-associated ABC transporter substrate-binding protein GldG n=1 Tax=Labilibaculum euxinus TaxID=2686357 RepID=UPI000F6218A6|nr:gliding motility-associated ABC transporter substrate-binding protein GldG [Labilibaculum euxinus]MDQ1770717.1 gliding motility-associated ABC transporter substrate-binding protein GldG [Labilibaculum euxinus]MWN75888.1 gliding motility-associated ABC transporter substrate-binding protein GldG [Labilibaculum euxinus]
MVRNRKLKDLFQLLISLLALVIVIQVLQMYFFRLDLTSEKRYSLSDNTKELVSHLEKDLYFEVYLSGDLPYGFTKLQKACLEMIDEFSSYSNVNILYSLINPNDVSNPKKRKEFLDQLVSRGLKPINLQEKTTDGSLNQKLVVPGIIVHDREKETSVHLLKSVAGLSSDQNLNHSIEELEFELTSAIRMLQNNIPKEIAFLTGHGELGEYEVADFTASLLQRYEVNRINAKDLNIKKNRYSALVIAQPRKEFSEEDKYQIDQYVMNGGRVMWLVDEVIASMDSLVTKESTMAFFQPLNMEDQLFRYGVRINPDLVMDVQSQLIPVQTALPGQPVKFTPAPWYYSPLLAAPDSHPITRKLNVIKAEFANSIDFVGDNKQIKKQVLLASSEYTRLEKVPKPISLNIVNQKMEASDFPAGSKNIAVLLEGIFPSVFQNRIWKGINKNDFKPESVPTKMIVISDGDVIKNRVRGVGNNRQIEALGYDRYSKSTYGNRNFLLNCVDYLCDDNGWMQLRSREVKLRMLNKTKIRSERLFWQLVNVLLPLILLLVFGLVRFYVRKRKFASSVDSNIA